MTTIRGFVAIVPAKDEAERVRATVTALRGLDDVRCVVVVDDGSADRTAEFALEAGADVIRHLRNRGKAAAMTTGAARAAELGLGDAALLFADADLEGTASALGVLVTPVLAGAADMTIATLPPQRQVGGGRGRVVRLARAGIEQRTGFVAAQPLSGMRCLTPAAYAAALPLAPGWGVEVGLTIDVLRAGLRVVEVPCELRHRVTGTDLRARLHRAAQLRDVWRALRRRRTQSSRTQSRLMRGRR